MVPAAGPQPNAQPTAAACGPSSPTCSRYRWSRGSTRPSPGSGTAEPA